MSNKLNIEFFFELVELQLSSPTLRLRSVRVRNDHVKNYCLRNYSKPFHHTKFT